MSVFDIIIKYWPALLHGLGMTCMICGLVWCTGLLAGVPIGIAATRIATINTIVAIISTALQGVPILCGLLLMHYPVQAALNIEIDPFWTAIITYSFVHVFAMADVVRARVNEFPKQYILAARVLGVSDWVILRRITIPLLFRELVPAFLPLQNAILHASLFAGLISVPEIFRVCQRIVAREHVPVQTYTVMGLLMFVVSGSMVLLAKLLRKKFSRDISER